MRADKLSAYVLYLWLLASAIALLPFLFEFLKADDFDRVHIRKLMGTAISLVIPTTGLAFSRLLVDQTPSRRKIRKNMIAIIFLGVVSAPIAILATTLLYLINGVPADATPFHDASLIIPISTAAMFYVFGVAMKEQN